MKLLFVGDVMLGRLVNEVLKQKPSVYPWGDTLPIFRNADFRVCNLECVISDHGTPWTKTPKTFHFRSDSKNIEVLKTADINAVSLANNHTLDFESGAMLEMLNLLGRAGIAYTGAGNSFKEVSLPIFLESKGIKIAFLAFSENEPLWEATDKKPGIFYVPLSLEDRRAKKLFKLVSEAKKRAHLVVVSAHWGPNWGYRPQTSHLPFAHILIESGADIIFGHSCHVFQGIEVYQGRPILYSTGDFVDDYAVNPLERNDESFIFIVGIDKERITNLQLYPTLITNFQARLAKGEKARKIAQKMQNLCAEFKTPTIWQEKENCLGVLIPLP